MVTVIRNRLYLLTIASIISCILVVYFLLFRSKLFSPFCAVDNCDLSLKQSDNFICESDSIWNERKHIYKIQDERNMAKRNSSIFFLTNWEPNFHCSHARRVGNMGDGGKWICDIFRLKDHFDCLVYSVGSNGDFSFEVDLKQIMPNCEIHVFDQNFYVCPTKICNFHQAKFGDGSHGSKTWEMVLEELNHKNQLIDILKIDIEGSEYDFFPQIFTSVQSFGPRQILVEVHPNKGKTIHKFFELLRDNNYVIFNKEPNLLAGADFVEYAFFRLHSDFFEKS